MHQSTLTHYVTLCSQLDRVNSVWLRAKVCVEVKEVMVNSDTVLGKYSTQEGKAPQDGGLGGGRHTHGHGSSQVCLR
jgi:hypothetical protein